MFNVECSMFSDSTTRTSNIEHRTSNVEGKRVLVIGGGPARMAGAAVLGFGALTFAENLARSRAMLAIMRMGCAGREALADAPFGEWLDAQRQPISLVKKFYDPIVVSGLNEETRRASSSYAIQIFQD